MQQFTICRMCDDRVCEDCPLPTSKPAGSTAKDSAEDSVERSPPLQQVRGAYPSRRQLELNACPATRTPEASAVSLHA